MNKWASRQVKKVTFFAALCLLLAACGDGGEAATDILFQDRFVTGETGSWVIEGDELARTAVLNEQLIIAIDAPNLMQFTTLSQPSFADFVLEVDASQVAGDLESSYGVLFRMQDATQFYRFGITSNGLYLVERHNTDGTWARLMPEWTESAAINQGLNTPNKLKVVAVGPSLAFYVNDTLLQELTDTTYGAGTVALDAGTFGKPGVQVVFDNVVIKRP